MGMMLRTLRISNMKMMKNNLLYYDFGSSDITAFTTTRHGGCSVGDYASMNVNTYCGDDAEHIAENRRRLCALLGIESENLVFPHQVHGTAVREVFCGGISPDCLECDAVTTDVRGLCIGVSTADCVPVLVHDPVHHAVAAIHAGWRGTVKRIVGKTLDFMHSRYGTFAADCRAVIGPCIGVDAFEVGDEVYEAFAAEGFSMDAIAVRYDKYHIDLVECNRLQLTEMGLLSENIQLSGVCTFTQYSDFFSARRLSIHSGRLLTGIMMK